MALRPGGARAKGASGELEAATLLTGWAAEVGIDLTIERNLEQVRSSGADLIGVPNMEVEVKRVEGTGVAGWWRQVLKVSGRSGKWPMLMHRRNRHPWRFRTYIYAAVYTGGGQDGMIVPLVADLELDQAKLWFQAHIKQNLTNED